MDKIGDRNNSPWEKAILNFYTCVDITSKYLKGEIDRNKRKTKILQS